MTFTVVLIALFIAIAFSSWPIVGRYSQASGAWISVLVMSGTLFSILGIASRQITASTRPAVGAMLLLITMGMVNGLAGYIYAVKVADQNIPTAMFVITVSVLMVMMVPFVDWLLNGSVISPKQWIGILIAIIAIILIKK